MTTDLDRRDFLTLAGLGGIVFASGLGSPAFAQQQDFFFVQLSDTHWGFRGPDTARVLHVSTNTVMKE